MKKVIILSVLFLLTAVSYASTSGNRPNQLKPVDDTIWCNKFVISLSVGQGGAGFSITTEILVCCVALHLQTCFTMDPRQPGNYIAPVYIQEMDAKVLKEIEGKGVKELTINKSTSVEIEKSFYAIQKGTYRILKNEKGLYIDTVLEKIK